jgi:hypothetical protein
MDMTYVQVLMKYYVTFRFKNRIFKCCLYTHLLR